MPESHQAVRQVMLAMKILSSETCSGVFDASWISESFLWNSGFLRIAPLAVCFGDGRQAPLSSDLKSFLVEVSLKLFDYNLLFFELLFELPLLFDELRQFGLETLGSVWDRRVAVAKPLVLRLLRFFAPLSS